ncbi:MAG: NUMOD4 motif-containing HNH endonuclease [Acidobacteriales bacterium]|nr:NUMOD4 motif-containing HNH endonuclease [Terriglobales bacterium]
MVNRKENNGRGDTAPTKQCTSCKTLKPITDFYPRKDRRLGIESKCKQCNMRAAIEYRRKRSQAALKAKVDPILPDEEWRTIPEFQDYAASSLGRVRRETWHMGATQGRILNPFPNRNGYLFISIHSNGGRFDLGVHRIVLFAFVGPCPDGMQVNHINGDKADNRLSNLEYVTPSQNTLHALHTLKARKSGKRLPLETVRRIRQLYASEGVSQSKLSRQFNLSMRTIGNIVHRRTYKNVDAMESPIIGKAAHP